MQWLALAAVAIAVGCARAPGVPGPDGNVRSPLLPEASDLDEAADYDPWQPFNEAMFSFNHDVLDRWLMKPVATGWDKVVPAPARRGLARVLDNLEMPRRLVNNLLQARPLGAGRELARFVVNTTVGVGGLFDVAIDARHRAERRRRGPDARAVRRSARARTSCCRPCRRSRCATPSAHRSTACSIRSATSFRSSRTEPKSVVTAVNERSLKLKLFAERRGQRARPLQRGAQRLPAAASRVIVRASPRARARNGSGRSDADAGERAVAVARRRRRTADEDSARPTRAPVEPRPQPAAGLVGHRRCATFVASTTARGRARRLARDPRGRDLRAARTERRRQDHAALDDLDAAPSDAAAMPGCTASTSSHDVDAARRLLNVAPQEEALYPSLTAAENLAFFAELYGVPRAERRRRVADALEAVGLDGAQRRSRRHLLGRHAAAAEPRLRARERPAARAARRAHGRGRSAVARPHLRRRAGAPRARHHHPLHDALPRRRPRTSATASRSWTRAAWWPAARCPSCSSRSRRRPRSSSCGCCEPLETLAPIEALDGVRDGRGDRPRAARLHDARAAGAAADLSRRRRARPQRRPHARHAGDARRRLPRAHGQGAARLMRARRDASSARDGALARSRVSPRPRPPSDGPLALTRDVLEQSNAIVRGTGDRKEKLADAERAAARLPRHRRARAPRGGQAPRGTERGRGEGVPGALPRVLRAHLRPAPAALRRARLRLRRGDGRPATRRASPTEVVTPGDRFAVDYKLHRTPAGWRATDIDVEGVSLARNFRSQFDTAVAKDSFQGLLRAPARQGRPRRRQS